MVRNYRKAVEDYRSPKTLRDYRGRREPPGFGLRPPEVTLTVPAATRLEAPAALLLVESVHFKREVPAW